MTICFSRYNVVRTYLLIWSNPVESMISLIHAPVRCARLIRLKIPSGYNKTVNNFRILIRWSRGHQPTEKWKWSGSLGMSRSVKKIVGELYFFRI